MWLRVLEVMDEYCGEAGSHPGADLVRNILFGREHKYLAFSILSISSITAMLRIWFKSHKRIGNQADAV